MAGAATTQVERKVASFTVVPGSKAQRRRSRWGQPEETAGANTASAPLAAPAAAALAPALTPAAPPAAAAAFDPVR